MWLPQDRAAAFSASQLQRFRSARPAARPVLVGHLGGPPLLGKVMKHLLHVVVLFK